MRISLLTSLLYIFAAFLPIALFAAVYDTSEDDLENFRQQMRIEVKKADEKAQAMQKGIMVNKTSPMTIDKVAFGNAIMMLDVKKTLYNNFVNNPVIKSPVMQQAILNILRKDIIQESDLAYLQSIADQERAKMSQSTSTNPSP